MHVLFSCDNSKYMWWQAEFLQYTYTKAGMRAPLTALVSVTEEKPRTFSCSSVTVSNYRHCCGEALYAPLNKPGGISDWLRTDRSPDETVFIVDPDSAFMNVIPEPGVAPGQAYSQEHRYLHSDLPASKVVLRRHCSAKLHNRVQPVGIYILIRKSDLRRLAPRWLQKSIEIRSDRTCRDALPHNGWVSEMWGYVIAAAESGIHHHIADLSQATGENQLSAPIIHYCFPVVKRDAPPWRSGTKGVLWSKWSYHPWQIPLIPSNAPPEGRALLARLAEFAALRGTQTFG